MGAEEFFRPRGLTLDIFAEELAHDTVREKLALRLGERVEGAKWKSAVSAPAATSAAAPAPTPLEAPVLKNFLRELRVADLGDAKDWFIMLGAVLLFLLGESVLVILLGHPAALSAKVSGLVEAGKSPAHVLRAVSVLTWFTYGNFFLISVLAVALSICLWIHWQNIANKPSVRPLWVDSPSALHSVPVVVAAVGVLVSNFALVVSTGWNASPFLPGLLGISAVVVGLPRENNRVTVTVSTLAFLAGAVGLAVSGDPGEWPVPNLALPLNLGAFVFAVLLKLALRSVASKAPKVEK